ncbi:unnamed protein product [Rangifer tarandus platyrhynchus]|uniref:Uncharacterized protein n=2 Tax=Rangifer tarandus platyrhynchus TaxID=3082113 RepID=A0ABN8ZV51_RANTA|nr:unnamed protein product [Rangifer tarandus platyrhynchus]
MKSGQLSPPTYCLEDNLGPSILDHCRCSEKTQGSFCDTASMLKARALFESTPDHEKENHSLPASLRWQLEDPGTIASGDLRTLEPGRKQDIIPMPSLGTEENSF